MKEDYDALEKLLFEETVRKPCFAEVYRTKILRIKPVIAPENDYGRKNCPQ